jgi:hypothetical protein
VTISLVTGVARIQAAGRNSVPTVVTGDEHTKVNDCQHAWAA